MSIATRRNVLTAGLLGAACACLAPVLARAADAPKAKYVCPPCGCAADGKEFDAPGACPECGMPLVPKTADKPEAPTPKARASFTRSAPAPADRMGKNGWGTRTRT